MRNLAGIPAYVGEDGAQIQELEGHSTGLTSHSLAVIAHPPGSVSRAHHHTVADEIYLVQSGRGQIRVDGATHELAPGDIVAIRPGQVHKVWNEGPQGDGPQDLVLIVTCAPAYSVDEVVWDE
jgi:mannose-6-phosphate isomerase-like protein (cupin superfamily)